MMCPNLRCRAVLGVPSTARGRTVRCRNCGCSIRIPASKPRVPGNDDEPANDQSHSKTDAA